VGLVANARIPPDSCIRGFGKSKEGMGCLLQEVLSKKCNRIFNFVFITHPIFMVNIPQPIREAIQNNRLILWIGAGFSQRRLDLPSWRGLVDELLDACLPPSEAAALKTRLDAKNLNEVAALEQLKTHKDICTGILKKRFSEHFDAFDERLSDFHHLWFVSQKIITTNYDMGLDCTKPPQVRKILTNNKWQLQDLSGQPHFYLKLHGCATDPESCVLFADQYADLYRQTLPDASGEQETLAKFRLKQLMADHVVLFIGFGMEESVSLVLDYLHQLLDGTGQPRFLLTKKGDDRTWPHTEKWLLDDWPEVPQVLNQLIEAKQPYAPVHEPLEDIRQKFQRAYVGRDDAVDKVEAFFNSERRFFFLYGAGGMGKSHLLDAVFKRLDPARQPLYFKITRDTRLSHLARAIGMPLLLPSRQDRPHPAFLKALDRLDRPVVIDDFYECSEEILYHSLLALPDQSKGKYMLISRSLPKDFAEFGARDFRPLELRELTEDAFRDCLLGLNQQFEYFPILSDQVVEQCWALTQGYPLGGHLLLGLFAEPDFDPDQIQRLDLEHDPERKGFVERLLAVILKAGREAERDLAHQVSVFDEAVPEDAFVHLPAWRDDREPFHALWKRKGLLARHFEEKTILYGMHALIRGLLLEKFGDPPEARKAAGAYYEAQSNALPAAEQMAALEKALDHYERSPESSYAAFIQRVRPRFVEVNVVQLRNKNDRERQIQDLSFRLRISPDDVSAANELGMAYRAAGRLTKAIEVLQKAADAGNVHAMNELGITLREAGQRERAIEVLQKAADAGNVHAMNELGITLREAGQRERAIEVLQKAADAGNVHAMNELGITLREAGQRERAIEVLQKAADAGNIQSFNELGITLREAGQRERAIEVLQKAVDAGHVPSMNELGITLREAGQRERAIEVLQKAADAGNIPSINELGITLREAGQPDKAIEVLQNALRKKPNNTFIKHNLLQIYLFFQPRRDEIPVWLAESRTYLKSGSLKLYVQIAEQIDVLLGYESTTPAEYRFYVAQLFRLNSWHFAVEYLTGLVQKHPRGEFKAKLGEALCQPVIGRASEGIPLLREAMEEFYPNPKLRWLWQQTALVLLEALSHKGRKEFRRNYERLEPDMRDYAPFVERRPVWEAM
jgi:tetratricopeptide (TPR) repeat protein